MSQVLANVKNLSGDFWEQNPQLAFITPFNELKKKKNSSKVMTAIYLICDAKSAFKATSMTEQEIMNDVSKNFLGDEKFPWEDYAVYLRAYKDKCRSFLHKKVDHIFMELDEMEVRRKELALDDPFEMEMKLKLFDAIKKYYTEAIELQQKLNEEVGEQTLYGEYQPSLIEQYSL